MNKDTLVVSAIIVAKLLTRLPMKRGERPTVSVCIGVIILFFINGILHLIYFSSLSLVSSWVALNLQKIYMQI
jgi:hypothetical protein